MTLRGAFAPFVILAAVGCGGSQRSDEGSSEGRGSDGPGFFLIRPTPRQQRVLSGGLDDYADVSVDAVSDDGLVAVGTSYVEYTDADGFPVGWVAPYRWTRGGGTVGLTLPGISASEPNVFLPAFTAMNSTGSVLVGTTSADFPGGRAFRWTPSGATDLGPADARSAGAIAVSEDGSVVAGWFRMPAVEGEENFEQAFVWTRATGTIAIGALPGDLGAVATWVKRDGSVVVGRSIGIAESTAREVLFRWTREGGMTPLGNLPGCESYRISATSRDAVAGRCGTVRSSVGSPAQSFVWTDETGLVGLGNPSGADDSLPSAVTTDGSVVVGDAIVGAELSGAFRWTRETGLNEVLSVPGAERTRVLLSHRTMSDDGSVVVGNGSNPMVADVPFRWSSDAGYSPLEPLPDASQTFVGGVSGDGRTIVGSSVVGQSINILWQGGGPVRMEDRLAREGVRAPEVWVFLRLSPTADGRILYGTAQVEQGIYGYYLELASSE